MMQRNEWKFNYTAEDLFKGAKAKVEWHKGRFDFWCNKQDAIKREIGEKGIVIDEGAGGEGYMSTNVRGPTARIDSKLQDHLRQATQKVMEHRDKVTIYQGWVKILAAQKSISMYPCDHNDWIFFFGETVSTPIDPDLDGDF